MLYSQVYKIGNYIVDWVSLSCELDMYKELTSFLSWFHRWEAKVP